MTRILARITISACLGLVLTTAILLVTPFSAFAAGSCTADCPGKTVTCEPDSNGNCWATDNVGCTGKTTKGCSEELLLD